MSFSCANILKRNELEVFPHFKYLNFRTKNVSEYFSISFSQYFSIEVSEKFEFSSQKSKCRQKWDNLKAIFQHCVFPIFIRLLNQVMQFGREREEIEMTLQSVWTSLESKRNWGEQMKTFVDFLSTFSGLHFGRIWASGRRREMKMPLSFCLLCFCYCYCSSAAHIKIKMAVETFECKFDSNRMQFQCT